MSRGVKIAVVVIVVVSAIVGVMALALPGIIRTQTINALQEATGRSVKVGNISVNPLTMTVTVDQFSLAAEQPQAAPLVAIPQVTASFSPRSLLQGTLVISSLKVTSPSVAFSRLGDNRYSFSDIVERFSRKPKQEQKKPFVFSINNINLTNGSVDFDDRAVSGGRQHTIRNLTVTLPFIGNSPDKIDIFTTPRLSCQVNGVPFSLEGKSKPFSDSKDSTLHLVLKQLPIAPYLAYSPVRPRFSVPSGSVSADVELGFRSGDTQRRELYLAGVIRLDDLTIKREQGEQLLRVGGAEFRAKKLDMMNGQYDFSAITLQSPEYLLARDARGGWSHDGLFAPRSKSPVAESVPPVKKQAAGITVTVAELGISNGLLRYRDITSAGPFKIDFASLNLTLKHLSSAPDQMLDYVLSSQVNSRFPLESQGKLGFSPFGLDGTVSVKRLPFTLFKPYIEPYLASLPQGTADISGTVGYAKTTGFRLSGGNLGIKDFSCAYGNGERCSVSALNLRNVAYQARTNRLEIAELALGNSSVALSRLADGSFSPLQLIRKRSETSRKGADTTATRGGTAPFSLRIGLCRVDGFSTQFTDRKTAGEPQFRLRNTKLSLSGLEYPRYRTMPVSFATVFNNNTPFRMVGQLTPRPFHYTGSIVAGSLPIRDFEDYFPDNVNVFVIGGNVEAGLKVNMGMESGKLTGHFSGNAAVRDFHSLDTVAEEDLLKWESLQFDDLTGDISPFSLSLREIALNNVYSRIIVRQDGTLNLQNLVTKKDVQQPISSATTPTPTTKSRSNVSIGAVTIQEGTLAFTDKHLPQTFNSTFYNLGGRISGLSSEEFKYADVDLRGNLENHSPLQITGTINPLRDDLFVNLKVAFKDIELSPVTPYSATYLGYEVDKGKLYLDLNYRIEQKKLDSENKIFIDQFTFGKKVESDKATSLPVGLAVALLKDRNGEIHLDLPVTGRTDDPQFSLWGLAWQAVKNLFLKAVSSPFALLSSLAGEGQDLGSIAFCPGSARLSEEEAKKLVALAKVLADRPGLKVEVIGFVDKERDPEGYRRELLDQKIRTEKFLALARERQLQEGETAETITLSPAEYSRYLSQVYDKEKFPKPRNFIGIVKKLPDDEMIKLIIANTIVGDEQLQHLARERVKTVVDYLTKTGGLASEQLFQKIDNMYQAPEKSTIAPSRVEFGAISK